MSFAGTLVFSQTKGAFLELKGYLLGKADRPTHEYETITGETPQGLRITHCRCSIQNTNYYSSSIIYAEWVFIGEHFKNLESIEFETLIINYSGIKNLIDGNELWWFLVKLPDESRKNWVTFMTKTVVNTCELNIIVRPLEEIPPIDNLEDNIDRLISVEIKSLSSKSFERYLLLEGCIFDFLNFALPVPIVRNSISTIFEKADNPKGNSEPRVEVLYKSPIGRIDKIAVGDAKLFHAWPST